MSASVSPASPSKSALAFRQALRRSLLLNKKETAAFDRIPDVVIDGVFRHNFNGNLKLAERLLFNHYSQSEQTDGARLAREKQAIPRLKEASASVSGTLLAGDPVLFVTDNDNDGSLSQAILMEFVKCLPADIRDLVHVEYAQPIGSARGLTIEVVDKAVQARGWSENASFTIVTADNGINNRGEQEKIAARYPNSKLVITDHHNPDPRSVVLENARTVVFNPKYLPTEYFKRKNISGADTLGVLLATTVDDINKAVPPPDFRDGSEPAGRGIALRPCKADQALALGNMAEIGRWANLLDYANADIADMPTRPYTIDKALQLRPLLNVSTSMSNLVTGTFAPEAIAEVAQASNGLSVAWIQEAVDNVQALNALSKKLLSLYHRFMRSDQGDSTEEGSLAAKEPSDFYAALSAELVREDSLQEGINPNHIEQLRPIIFNLSAIDNKPIALALLAECMVGTFEELRHEEKRILEGLRTVGLLRADTRANSSIMYPIHPSVTKLFNRRLLGKAYNQANNGFHLILSSLDRDKASGSMRSLYSVHDILEGKESICKDLGVAIEVLGHDMAAGFTVSSTTDDPITEAKMGRLNEWLDGRVGELKMKERVNQLPTLDLDFASIGLMSKVNAAIKANLAGMWGIPAILRFSPDKDKAVWVTDAETTRQVSLADIVREKRYGYQAIRTSFHGDAVVVPVELLRAVVDSNYQKALRLSYMNEGVYMASQVVDPEQMPELVQIQAGRTDLDDLAEYYEKEIQGKHFLDLSREDFRSSPYFRFNRYGEQEFENWESMIIEMLDTTDQDVLAVVDTEGTGLGKAPKCFNIGGTNVMVDPDSGTTMPLVDFEPRYMRDSMGEEYFLTKEQLESLIPLAAGEESPEDCMVLHSATLDRGVDYAERFAFKGAKKDLERLTNVRERAGQVVYNRRVKGFAFSYLVSDVDFAITKEFEDLTGVSNEMVHRLGTPSAKADAAIVKYYRGLKGANGRPAKIIFQAHNMPYDLGVAMANFQKLVDLMEENVISDTAKIARKFRLAYDSTPASSFTELESVPPKLYFYDSPYSDYSLRSFLERCGRGKGGVFPDTTAKVLLRFRPELNQFSLIDRVANREVQLPYTLEELQLGRKEVEEMPLNAVKYSVERMSARAMIRNIILLDKPSPKKVPLSVIEAKHASALTLFQEKYHFDMPVVENIENFVSSLPHDKAQALLMDIGEPGLMSLAARFLELNCDLQAKFHDGWIYEKVLAVMEPDAKTLRIPDEVVEQVSYLTDLPPKKIREVFQATVNYKRHFGLDHALVHEEHNNIRQRSEDGHGLSDTAYEVVLPQHLAMMRFYNPYYHGNRKAVMMLRDANMEGAMVQHTMGTEFRGDVARDSYSMTQMLAFDRAKPSDIIQQAMATASGKTRGRLEEIKFRLGSEILPEHSALYGEPRRHLSQDEVRAASEKLAELVVVEQIKSAVDMGSNMEVGHARRVLSVAEANDNAMIRLRDEVMKSFKSIKFERREKEAVAANKMVTALFDGEPRIPKGTVINDSFVELLDLMIEARREVLRKVNKPVPEEAIELFREQVKSYAKECEAKRIKAEARAQKAAAKKAAAAPSAALADAPGEPYRSRVRTEAFLPHLDIQRLEPMKFLLDHHGVRVLLPLIKAQQCAAAAKRATEVLETVAAPAEVARPRP